MGNHVVFRLSWIQLPSGCYVILHGVHGPSNTGSLTYAAQEIQLGPTRRLNPCFSRKGTVSRFKFYTHRRSIQNGFGWSTKIAIFYWSFLQWLNCPTVPKSLSKHIMGVYAPRSCISILSFETVFYLSVSASFKTRRCSIIQWLDCCQLNTPFTKTHRGQHHRLRCGPFEPPGHLRGIGVFDGWIVWHLTG